VNKQSNKNIITDHNGKSLPVTPYLKAYSDDKQGLFEGITRFRFGLWHIKGLDRVI
jgi:hypothetical protein